MLNERLRSQSAPRPQGGFHRRIVTPRVSLDDDDYALDAAHLGLSLVEFRKHELMVATIRELRGGGRPVPWFLDNNTYTYELNRAQRLLRAGVSRRALRWFPGIGM